MACLTGVQRYTITAVALAIGRDKSVVSRELRRNGDQRDSQPRKGLGFKTLVEYFLDNFANENDKRLERFAFAG